MDTSSASGASSEASSSAELGRQAKIAKRSWEAANNIEVVPSTWTDDIFHYDRNEQQQILAAKPWEKDPHFFKDIRISALALLKMVMHARSGGTLEVMGLLIGKVDGNCMIVMDSFALPVEGTETRVNAQSQAYEYMTAYMDAAKQVGRLENAIGWYHSHPGYGCWLSGIDVSTQMLNQNYQEPFVAIVIDPTRTISAGKVNLGAFRTYPKGYKPSDDGPPEYQTIPLHKIEDFGVHCRQYYALDVTYFKSSLDGKLLDSLWNKYWLNTLSSSPLLTNAEYTNGQLADLADKLEQAENQVGRYLVPYENSDTRSKTENKLEKVSRDSSKTAIESLQGLMSQVIKDRLFNQIGNRGNGPQLTLPVESQPLAATSDDDGGLNTALEAVFGLLGGTKEVLSQVQSLEKPRIEESMGVMEFADIIRVPKVDKVVLHRAFHASVDGTLCITGHHLILSSRRESQEELWILHKAVDTIEKRSSVQTNTGVLTLKCKDFRVISLEIVGLDDFNAVASSLEKLSNVADVTFMYPFFYRPMYSILEDGWGAFPLETEYAKLVGSRSDDWRISHVNKDFEVCLSYPPLLIVPKSVDDQNLASSAGFRLGGRFPTLSFCHQGTGAVMLRSSRPLCGQGQTVKRCKADESLLNAVLTAGSRGYVIDTKLQNLAQAAKSRGTGYEQETYYPQWKRVHKPLENPAGVMESLAKLMDACNDTGASMDKWLSKLDASDWMGNVKELLTVACLTAQCMDQEKASVLVHGGDGLDATLQITSLVQIILDPDCRTVRGFEALVEREWVQAGHPFATRNFRGCYAQSRDSPTGSLSMTGHGGNVASPTFLVFLDAVRQIHSQFLCSFQFTEDFLSLLFEHSYFSQFGTFLCDSELDRRHFKLHKKTVSLWSHVNRPEVLQNYLNPLYEPNNKVLWPSVAPMSLSLWPSVYLRWISGTVPDKTRWRAMAELKHKECELRSKAARLRKQLQELERGICLSIDNENAHVIEIFASVSTLWGSSVETVTCSRHYAAVSGKPVNEDGCDELESVPVSPILLPYTSLTLDEARRGVTGINKRDSDFLRVRDPCKRSVDVPAAKDVVPEGKKDPGPEKKDPGPEKPIPQTEETLYAAAKNSSESAINPDIKIESETSLSAAGKNESEAVPEIKPSQSKNGEKQQRSPVASVIPKSTREDYDELYQPPYARPDFRPMSYPGVPMNPYRETQKPPLPVRKTGVNYGKCKEGHFNCITDAHLKCGSYGNTVHLQFAREFKGKVYIADRYDCMLYSATAQPYMSRDIQFTLHERTCPGYTKGYQMRDMKIMVQFDPTFVSKADVSFLVKCYQGSKQDIKFEYTVEEPGTILLAGETQQAYFTVKITKGEHPDSPGLMGKVYLGEILHLHVGVEKKYAKLAVDVAVCWAVEAPPRAKHLQYNYNKQRYSETKVQMVDHDCSNKPEFLGNFQTYVQNYGRRAMIYKTAKMKAFRFPTSDTTVLKCRVNLCYGKCPGERKCKPVYLNADTAQALAVKPARNLLGQRYPRQVVWDDFALESATVEYPNGTTVPTEVHHISFDLGRYLNKMPGAFVLAAHGDEDVAAAENTENVESSEVEKRAAYGAPAPPSYSAPGYAPPQYAPPAYNPPSYDGYEAEEVYPAPSYAPPAYAPQAYGPAPSYAPPAYGPAPSYAPPAYGPAPPAYGPAPSAYGPAPPAYEYVPERNCNKNHVNCLVDVRLQCYGDEIQVEMEFKHYFTGVIYLWNKYDECMLYTAASYGNAGGYGNYGGGQKVVKFTLSPRTCPGYSNGEYSKGTYKVMTQYDPMLVSHEDVNFEAKCEQYNEPPRVLKVQYTTLDAKPIHLTVSSYKGKIRNAKFEVHIRKGWSVTDPVLYEPVKMGEKLTIHIVMKAYAPNLSTQVSGCWAVEGPTTYDKSYNAGGGGDGYKSQYPAATGYGAKKSYRQSEVYLIKDGCSLKPKVIGNFVETISSYSYGLTSSSVAYLKAFRFPRSNTVMIRSYAPPAYGPPAYGPPAYGPPAYAPPEYEPPAYEAPSYAPPAYGPPAPEASYGPPQRKYKRDLARVLDSFVFEHAYSLNDAVGEEEVESVRMRRDAQTPTITLGDTMAWAECQDSSAIFSVSNQLGFNGTISLASWSSRDEHCHVEEEVVERSMASVSLVKSDETCDPYEKYLFVAKVSDGGETKDAVLDCHEDIMVIKKEPGTSQEEIPDMYNIVDV
ncbi:unnamed protein product [Notodromas monacha]|uniref:COP9 signalosome complex subunit 5 n=1 Tax=Notodromas monacha TaxID=399045 RepID=A0A7R9G9I2_9CRUS|nr:unnamed protein product [Notodromas monacha]CAG0912921.1 unnamed protein product [Notodromas monacha]